MTLTNPYAKESKRSSNINDKTRKTMHPHLQNLQLKRKHHVVVSSKSTPTITPASSTLVQKWGRKSPPSPPPPPTNSSVDKKDKVEDNEMKKRVVPPAPVSPATTVPTTTTTASASALVISASHKAGMEGIDRKRIDEIILRESGNSKYMQQQKRRDERVNERIEIYKRRIVQYQKQQQEQQSNFYNSSNNNNSLSENNRRRKNRIDEQIKQYQLQQKKRSVCVVIDMDMFYMACELLLDPKLKYQCEAYNIPACVDGGNMILTSNYAARRYGVRSAMPGWIGDTLVAELSNGTQRLVHVKSNYELYRIKSKQVREVLEEYDPQLRSFSLDEAYLDLTLYLAMYLTISMTPSSVQDVANEDDSDDPEFRALHERIRKNLTMQSTTTAAAATSSTTSTTHKNKQTAVDNEESILHENDHFSDDESDDDDDDNDEKDNRHKRNHFVNVKNNTNATNNNNNNNCYNYNYTMAEGIIQSFSLLTCQYAIERIVRNIRHHVYIKTKGLTCSAGIGCNFSLAKIASDYNKPNGQYYVSPIIICHRQQDQEEQRQVSNSTTKGKEDDKQASGECDNTNDNTKNDNGSRRRTCSSSVLDFIHPLSVRKIPGIGRVTEKILQHACNIHTVKDLYEQRYLISWLFSSSSNVSNLSSRTSKATSSSKKSLSSSSTATATATSATANFLLRASVGCCGGSFTNDDTNSNKNNNRNQKQGNLTNNPNAFVGHISDDDNDNNNKNNKGNTIARKHQVASIPKSMSRERTFFSSSSSSSTWTDWNNKLDDIAYLLSNDMKRKNLQAHTVSVKVKLDTFDVLSKSITLQSGIYISSTYDLSTIACQLLSQLRLEYTTTDNNNSGSTSSSSTSRQQKFFPTAKGDNEKNDDNDDTGTTPSTTTTTVNRISFCCRLLGIRCSNLIPTSSTNQNQKHRHHQQQLKLNFPPQQQQQQQSNNNNNNNNIGKVTNDKQFQKQQQQQPRGDDRGNIQKFFSNKVVTTPTKTRTTTSTPTVPTKTTKPSSSSPSSFVICPICQQRLQLSTTTTTNDDDDDDTTTSKGSRNGSATTISFHENDVLNRHIDACLNAPTIRKAVSQQDVLLPVGQTNNGTSTKRKLVRLSSSSLGGKNKKQRKRITDYWTEQQQIVANNGRSYMKSVEEY